MATDTQHDSTWELATDSGFTTIVQNSTASTSNLTSWTPAALTPGTTYYARVKYAGNLLGSTGFCPTVTFTTIAVVNAPSITSPANNATSIGMPVTFTSSAFSVAGGTDTQQYATWQIASDSGFTTIVQQSVDDATNKTSWTVSGLNPGTVYYVRVRYKGVTYAYGEYSSTTTFTTVATINAPTVTSPANNASGLAVPITFTGSAFAVSGGSDTQSMSTWQIATDAGFTNVVFTTIDDVANMTSWSPTGLASGTTYYVRVKYDGVALVYSEYSPAITFTTVATINAPSITDPTNLSTGNNPGVTITGSAFSVAGGTDTESMATWQLASDSGFTTIVQQSVDDVANKTSWAVTGLTPGATYYARVKYKGVTFVYSPYSATCQFKVAYINTPTITFPANSATNVSNALTLTSSAFAVNNT